MTREQQTAGLHTETSAPSPAARYLSRNGLGEALQLILSNIWEGKVDCHSVFRAVRCQEISFEESFGIFLSFLDDIGAAGPNGQSS